MHHVVQTFSGVNGNIYAFVTCRGRGRGDLRVMTRENPYVCGERNTGWPLRN